MNRQLWNFTIYLTHGTPLVLVGDAAMEDRITEAMTSTNLPINESDNQGTSHFIPTRSVVRIERTARY